MIPRSSIRLASGRYFDFDDLASNVVTIEDIAHALAHICRFCGHTRRFYSVAQHSVLASYHCADPYAALMHDAAEAVLGDVSSPLKRLLPDYRVIEERVESWLFCKFGVPFPLPACVKQADLLMLRWEQRDVMRAEADVWEPTADVTPPRDRIIPHCPDIAREMFLDRYRELST
jgi:hypothetical protein